MAEEFLVTKELTDKKIESGARVLACLDARGFPVVAAYWRFDFNARTWRLCIISPGVWSRIAEAYSTLQDVMRQLDIKGLNYDIDDQNSSYRELHRQVTFFSKTPMNAPHSWLPLGITMGEDLHVYRI